MFTVEERDRVRNRLVQMSRADPRLVAGALVGSTAGGGGDRWSDLDLTFGLADGAAVDDVLADWTARFANEFQAVHIFDLPHLSTIYRVFLLPNNLQVDLSFTPGNKFLGKGLKFDLLFGKALERDPAKPARSEEHTSELQSRSDLVCRLLLEKKKTKPRLQKYESLFQIANTHQPMT